MKYSRLCSTCWLDGTVYRREKEDSIRARAGHIRSPTDYCASRSSYIRTQSEYNPAQEVYRGILEQTW